jgi:hypothetical protein
VGDVMSNTVANFSYQKQTLQASLRYQSSETSANVTDGQQNQVYQSQQQLLQFEASYSQTSVSLSMSTEDLNQTLKVAYDKAIEVINTELEGTHGANAIQNAYDSGVDVSPEATAKRIVSFATGFYDTYRGRNKDLTDEQAVDGYMQVIGDAIDKGFKEAEEILTALNVFQGEIKENVGLTYDLVQEGLADYKEQKLESLAAG